MKLIFRAMIHSREGIIAFSKNLQRATTAALQHYERSEVVCVEYDGLGNWTAKCITNTVEFAKVEDLVVNALNWKWNKAPAVDCKDCSGLGLLKTRTNFNFPCLCTQ